ncbi:MAG: SH3 domain-containing protein [Clostridia bacterium]|nr:SH3 domain-containing protein [Clostridia bacterium]
MKSRKVFVLIAAIFMLCLMMCAALAEPARVVTPKGPLNMRKTPDDKGKLVDSVPNKSMVEVEEVGETWSKITYKKKTGYVKTDYLKLPQNMVGKEIYADEGMLLLLVRPREGKESVPVALPVGGWESVLVEETKGDWTKVSRDGVTGYVETKALSYQKEEPSGEIAWMKEKAIVTQQTEVRVSADAKAETIASLNPRDEVTVTLIEKGQCLVIVSKGVCGYVPASVLALAGPEDTDEQTGSLSRTEALSKAEAALRKKYKTFSKDKLYGVTAVENGTYRCGFFNDQDQYLFGALVDAEGGKAVFIAHYDGFAVLRNQPELLPEGEIELTLSADTMAVGDVLDIQVNAWTLHQAQYSLYFNGSQIIESEPGAHFSAAYRPRQAGTYKLYVTVTDEKGTYQTATAEFSVDGALTANDGVQEIYSQKDGWWKDKKYRHSNLGKSGCAIFALSHALSRMGITEEKTLPQNLATKYSYCLIPEEGTNNTLLINTAARDFGFTTQGELINEPEKIAGLIRNGAFFSFSIARGHIAMVSGISDDGSMVRVVDSAPLATFERIKDASQYYEKRPGVFRAALTLDDMPGARWFFETDEYGGMEYWLTMDYVAKRGVRLIQP